MTQRTTERTILQTFVLHGRKAGEAMPLRVIYEDCRPRALSNRDVETAIATMVDQGLLEIGPSHAVMTEEGRARLN